MATTPATSTSTSKPKTMSAINIRKLTPPLPLMAPYIPVRAHHVFPLAGNTQTRKRAKQSARQSPSQPPSASVAPPPPPPGKQPAIDPAFRTMDALLAWELNERKNHQKATRGS